MAKATAVKCGDLAIRTYNKNITLRIWEKYGHTWRTLLDKNIRRYPPQHYSVLIWNADSIFIFLNISKHRPGRPKRSSSAGCVPISRVAWRWRRLSLTSGKPVEEAMHLCSRHEPSDCCQRLSTLSVASGNCYVKDQCWHVGVIPSRLRMRIHSQPRC